MCCNKRCDLYNTDTLPAVKCERCVLLHKLNRSNTKKKSYQNAKQNQKIALIELNNRVLMLLSTVDALEGKFNTLKRSSDEAQIESLSLKSENLQSGLPWTLKLN